MSTLTQIESAVAGLPPDEQLSLFAWLQRRLKALPQSESATRNSLEVFRQLQAEMKLTMADAEAWKRAAADARR